MNYSIANLSKPQALTVALISLAAAYLIGSRALDTGSLWQYGLGLLLIIVSIRQLVRLFKKDHGGSKK